MQIKGVLYHTCMGHLIMCIYMRIPVYICMFLHVKAGMIPNFRICIASHIATVHIYSSILYFNFMNGIAWICPTFRASSCKQFSTK